MRWRLALWSGSCPGQRVKERERLLVRIGRIRYALLVGNWLQRSKAVQLVGAASLFALCGCELMLDQRKLSGVEGLGARVESAKALCKSSSGDTPLQVRPFRFTQGASDFSVAAEDGLLAPGGGDRAETLTGGVFQTARGGRVQLEADGAFLYQPPGEAGAFWGDDEFGYVVSSADSQSQACARVTVQTWTIRADGLEKNPGAGFRFLSSLTGSAALVRWVVGGFWPGSIAAAGDVNGDGKDDLVFGAVGFDISGNIVASGALVVWGKAEAEDAILSTPGDENSAGIWLTGTSDERLGFFSVAGAGDVNGDGFDDVIVGAPAVDNDLNPTAVPARAYVIFGRRDPVLITTSELQAGSSAGFTIEGGADSLGFAVSKAGDFNGDGYDDVLVGAPFASSPDCDGCGAAYVLFGSGQCTNVSVSNLPSGKGLSLLGAHEQDNLGAGVAGGFDVNGDGLDDVAMGATSALRETGVAYVVYGKRDHDAVSPAALEEGSPQGFEIMGVDTGDGAGASLSGIKDLNGDGFDELAVGAADAIVGSSARDDAESDDLTGWGAVYAVFGGRGSAPTRLSELEVGRPDGYVIAGSPPLHAMGLSVSAGDVNGDGLEDLLVGSQPDFQKRESKAYLVFGKADPAPVSLGALQTGRKGGLTIFGTTHDEFDLSNFTVATGADVNGDGLSDMVIGRPGVNEATRLLDRGWEGARVLFGWDMTGALGGRRGAVIGGAGDDLIDLPVNPMIVVRGGHGRDTLRVKGRGNVLDLRERTPSYASIEVVDLRGSGPNALILNDAAVRRIPGPQRGRALPFPLSKTLALLGDADDVVYMDLDAYDEIGLDPMPDGEDLIVYRRRHTYYGLETSLGLRILPLSEARGADR